MTAAADGTATSLVPASEEPRVPLGVIVTYALPPFGAGFMFLLVSLLLLKFATDELLIPPAAMGTIFLVSRLWDAVSDPVAGYWSDRTRTRMGRRRPWLLASAIPIGLTFWMMWSPPEALVGRAAIGWMAIAVIGFYSAMTILIVPHTSLGAELTSSYHDRTRVFGVRQLVWNAGTFLTLPVLYWMTTSSDPRGLAEAVALVAAVLTTGLIAFSAVRLRERSEYQGRGAASPRRAFSDVWRNPHARLLLVVFLIESLGGATIGALTIYFSEYVLETPSWTVFYIASYFLAATASIPLWIPLSRRIGKQRLWLSSMIATGLGFGITFTFGPGDVWPLMICAAVLGLAGGCGATVGPSVQADIIDYDEYQSGERKEGAYFAAWNFVYKSATGITLGLTGFVLQAAGFEPNQEQGETARLAIRSLYALFPLSCYAIGALLFSRFAFGESEHRTIRAELDRRNGGGPPTEP